jgi:hypothetical protein
LLKDVLRKQLNWFNKIRRLDMNKGSLDALVSEVILEFIKGDALFTALDVSNKVKETSPFVRHREVRELVRAAFAAEIEPSGYARTPIAVTLSDGSTTEALLYHPLADSWDLDSKYDAQKRGQAASTPIAAPPAVANPVVNVTVPATVTPAPSTPVPPPARVLWAQLFNSHPSLFPRK